MHDSYKLTLAGAFSLQITAGDKDALPIVRKLAQTMLLAPGKAEYSVLVLTGQEESLSVNTYETVRRFRKPKTPDDLISKVMQSSLDIAHVAQQRGGILVHGALAEWHKQGIIMAAPGGTGKTTASTRLPACWRSLSDDAVLIMPDGHGRYFAHPWPTWSRFYDGGPGGVWNVSNAVWLKGFYFLFQDSEDAMEGLVPSQAAAMLIESVEQVNRVFDRRLSPEQEAENHRQQFSIVCALMDHLPAYRLHLTLTGEFWKLIEESLVSAAEGLKEAASPKIFSGEELPIAPKGIVFYGNSMYPTLQEPDYLEVVSYGNNKPCRGDVIYFRSPGKTTMVVHRVMRVKDKVVITRGDNNPTNDRDPVSYSGIVGRVIAASGMGKKRKVRGGRAGMLDYYYACMLRQVKSLVVRSCRLLAMPSSLTGILRFFKPNRIQFKMVVFGRMPTGRLKIMVNNFSVGHFTNGVWHIAYPWRLWIDPEQIETASMAYHAAKRQWMEERFEKRIRA